MSATPRQPVLVVEDDPFTRITNVVLDPRCSAERMAAFADFFAHDLPDFAGWCARVRAGAGGLYPAEVRLLAEEDELAAAAPDADGLLVESFEVGPEVLAAAPRLKVVQKYGTNTRNIDLATCAERNIKVLTQRRRANIACAELTLTFILAAAKKLNEIDGLISVEQLEAAGYSPTTFDRRHTANSGWARISGLRMLYESTLGIVGMGEIGRELALRAVPFGMRTLYYQRNRLPESEEERLGIAYASFEDLLGESDWVSIQLPLNPSTRNLFDRTRLAQMKPGAVLVNTARAEIVERDALLVALRSGHLGGFALDPLYEEPGRPDDELLAFKNVMLTPHTAAQPRFNALRDLEEMILGLARAMGY
jgi:phosphoglycerate dehydrogenase-like enzyme